MSGIIYAVQVTLHEHSLRVLGLCGLFGLRFDCLREQTRNFVRARIGKDATLYKLLKQLYWTVKKTIA